MDGHKEDVHANLIAEYMYAQVDENGHIRLFLAEIVDHRCNPNTSIKEKDSYLFNNTGQKSRIHTTEGWDLLVS